MRYSFHTKFGETIDCIDFFAQEGVRAMAAQGSPITKLPTPAVQPSVVPPELQDVLFTGTLDDEGNPRACPPDSVPIVRITSSRIQAAGGLDSFIDAHRKAGTQGISDPSQVAPPDLTNYAHAQQDYTGGASLDAVAATVNIQKPLVIYPKDHSIVQTWTTNGGSGSGQETVECGSTVDPLLNGDRNPHFFIFATSNGYGNGCYNNVSGTPSSCLSWIGEPGASLTPGMTLASSTLNGAQIELSLQTVYGSGYGATGWNILGAGVYPSTDFTGSMRTSANGFSVGGEVYDHTSSWYTPMGSGAEPAAGYQQAAYWVAPGVQTSVHLTSGSWDSTSFNAPYGTIPTAYATYSSGGRNYFGPTKDAFYSSDYGEQFSPIGDWASGNYKATCDAGDGVAKIKGVAASTDGASTQAILCGDFIQFGYTPACYARFSRLATTAGALTTAGTGIPGREG